jgi:DNA-binding transcriptional MerR regulator
MTTSFYSIKDLENLTGIKAHTIRMWEQRYGIIKPDRTDSNIRLYDSNELKMMLNIALLNNNGFKISKIAQMSSSEVNEKVLETIKRNTSYEDQINALTVCMIDVEEDQFESIMSSNILQYGFEKTMINIIYPFLSRIGTLWLSASINPAQEHFITNLIRQKMIVAIDGCFEPNKTHAKKFVLFLPEGEIHEISLLFSAYLIKSRGNKLIYLGQSLPMQDVAQVHSIHKAEYLVCVITAVPSADQVQNYVNELAATFPEQQIILSGYQVVGQDIKTPNNVTIMTHINQMLTLVEDLKKAK